MAYPRYTHKDTKGTADTSDDVVLDVKLESQGNLGLMFWNAVAGDPVVKGSVNLPDFPRDIQMVGNLAYVIDANTGIQVVNVSNPAAPTLAGSGTIPHMYSSGRGIFISGNYAYVGSGAFEIMSLSNPNNPMESSLGYGMSGVDHGKMVIKGNYAYIAAGKFNYDTRGAFSIADITSPDNKTKNRGVSVLTFDHGYISAVALSGNYAFLTDSSNYGDIIVVDVSNPAQPKQVKTLSLSSYYGNPKNIVISGTTAYIADPGLTVLDISTPTNPVITKAGAGYANDVAVSGNRVYVVGPNVDTGKGRFSVYDTANPKTWLTSIETPGTGQAIWVSGRYAYVAQSTTDGKGILSVIDLSP